MPWVYAIGCVSAVGLDAAQTCAAVRARQSGIEAILPQAGDPLLAARVPATRAQRGSAAWLRRLLLRALREALAAYSGDTRRLALFVALPEPERQHPASRDGTGHAFMRRVLTALGLPFSPHSRVLLHGHASAVLGIQAATDLLARGEIDGALVGGADSLLNDDDRERLHAAGRLHEPGNPFGLIPGEAAAFFGIGGAGAPFSERALARIAGFGLGMEADDIVSQERFSVAEGLRAAVDAALSQAGLDEACIDWRITDINGERYRGWESTALLARAYRAWRDGLPCLHVPASTGDIGCASLPLQIVLGADAMHRGHAPGPLAICESSSEGPLRAACLIAAAGEVDPPFHSVAASTAWEVRPCIGALADRLPHELAWLAAHRQRVVHGRQRFSSLVDFDERLDAHMAHLRTLGQRGWHGALAAMEEAGPGGAFAPMAMALESGEVERVRTVLQHLSGDSESACRDSGVHAALGWASTRALRGIGVGMATSSLPLARRLAATAMHMHRIPVSVLTCQLIEDDDEEVCARALRLAADAGHADAAGRIAARLVHPAREVRYQAARALTLLGHGEAAAAALHELAGSDGPRREDAWRLLLRAASQGQAWHLLEALARESAGPEGLRRLVEACGLVGDVRSVPWLIEQVRHPQVQKLAAEAFGVITGMDLEGASAPPDAARAAAVHSEDGDDDGGAESDGSDSTDDELFPVDPVAVAAWWRDHAEDFSPHTRYFMGAPLSTAGCLKVLANGRQRHRRAAAEHVCLGQPGTVLFPVAAPAWRQRQLLASWGAA